MNDKILSRSDRVIKILNAYKIADLRHEELSKKYKNVTYIVDYDGNITFFSDGLKKKYKKKKKKK